MTRFLSAVSELYGQAEPATVLEVGCGEGRLADHLVTGTNPQPERFLATDISLAARAKGLAPLLEFAEASAYALPYADNSFDLVICCEVLEHLEHPAAALAELARVARCHVLLSTPWEPLWRAMNLARGKYLRAGGNTPGHIQHFGRRALVELATSQLQDLKIRRPLPWTVILGRVHAQPSPTQPIPGQAERR